MNFCTNLISESLAVFTKFTESNFSVDSVCLLKNLLAEGNLLAVEQQFKACLEVLESDLFVLFLNNMCQEMAIEAKLKNAGKEKGLSCFVQRKTPLYLANGHHVCIQSWYAQNAAPDYNGERNLFHLFFKTVQKCTPLHTSNLCATSVICPSFEVAADIMTEIGIETKPDKHRDIALSFGFKCENHADLILKAGETLAGKNVSIALDGGRCRTREPNNTFKNDSTHEGYNTPWIEPKLFVISTIDKNGQTNKLDLPIYDVAFNHDELFELLRTYLQKLEIHKAITVQITADGAPWIWNRARPFLETLGVEPQRIVETLDYYHAAEHLNDLVKYLPIQLQDIKHEQFKKLLWDGDIKGIKNELQTIFPDLETTPLKPFEYFEKNATRMNYKSYKENNLVCGSGIIESGIRRILNLRFKCPSSFWKPQNVKPLIFLRAAFLSKRWAYLQNNFYKI